MTIKNFTFFSPNGTEFPVGSNNDGKLYLMLAGLGNNGKLRKDWSSPVYTALNVQYVNTSLLVGGRYFELNNETLALTANSTNYIHANIDLTKTANPVSISAESADNTNSVDINNGSGVLKVCFDILKTDGVSVTGFTNVLSNRVFQNIEVSGNIKNTPQTISIPFTWAYGMTGTIRRTGNVVEWVIDRIAINGSTSHEQTADAVLPVGFRPINRAYVNIDLSNSSGPVPWAIARLDSNGNTYITNSATTTPRTCQGFGIWITNDNFPAQ